MGQLQNAKDSVVKAEQELQATIDDLQPAIDFHQRMIDDGILSEGTELEKSKKIVEESTETIETYQTILDKTNAWLEDVQSKIDQGMCKPDGEPLDD